MAILRIFDVSQYILAGRYGQIVSRGVIEDQMGYRSNEMPCGGLAYLLNTIHEFYKEDGVDLVFCVDKPPTIKRTLHEELFPALHGYKGNRGKKDYSIIVQREMAEEILKQMGFNVVCAEGYESDDCIASLVEYYKEQYDHIYIHNNDSDMFYLVCEDVTNISLNGSRIVTYTNWETAVKKNFIVPYNTITLNKLIDGEPGDGIPHIAKDMADRIMSYIPERMYSKCGNNNLLTSWVDKATGGDERTMGTLKLITPLIVDYDLIELHETEFDKDLYEYYATNLGNRYYTRFVPKHSTMGEDTIIRYLDEYMGGD